MRYLLHDVFSDSVKKFSKNVAVTTEGGRNATYEDLNVLSNKFANLFKEFKASIVDQPFVGILSPVLYESIAAILGSLKIGCAYIPLDTSSPTERLEKIIENTKLDVVVVDPFFYDTHKDLFANSHIEKVVLTGSLSEQVSNKFVSFETVLDQSSTEPEKLNQVSDDLAYILHSSGSTGIPKGIMLTHRNARTFVDWMQKEFQLNEKDVVMSRAPFKFDLSVFDIFNTFKAGAKLVCFDWNQEREGDEKHSDYVDLMNREKATFLYTTPSTFIALMNKGRLGKGSSLRTIMYAGEPFPPPQVKKLMEALPETKVANIYGPTETNIITYYWISEAPQEDNPIPLGHVVEDTEILVVSEEGNRICAPGELGELWCRGGTVTLGYLGMEDKTKESCVLSPFHKYPAYFWRTGDYGMRDELGILHYRGRKDHMVKVKGFRIEIGEIENALASYSRLGEFVVVAVPDEKYGNRLYCYYTTLSGKSVEESAFKNHLLKKLPDYMIPFRFTFMDVLPKTSSGKIDRVFLTEKSEEFKNY